MNFSDSTILIVLLNATLRYSNAPTIQYIEKYKTIKITTMHFHQSSITMMSIKRNSYLELRILYTLAAV